MKKLLQTTLALALILFGVQNLKAYDFTVSGQILTTQAQVPAPGVMAMLHIQGTGIFESTTSGDDGTYSITVAVEEVPQLTYEIGVFDICAGHPIERSGIVTPDGAVENFLICDSTNQECHADFMFHHNCQNPNPLEIVFQNTSHGFGSIVAFAWDFGDGNTSDEENPTYVYADYGTYDVSLTITTEGGCSDTRIKTVVIEDQSMNCHADFMFHHNFQSPDPLEIEFHSISQGFGPIVAFAWDFGDGNTSDEENPTNVFADYGSYEVSLTITTESGCTDTKTKTVVLEEIIWPCEASFEYHQPWHNPSEVHFIDRSQFQPGTWFWEFGDGETSGDKNPVHTYTAGGEYTVSLTINSADSTCVDTYSDVVVIEEVQWGCEASFEYHQSWQNPMEVHFFDKSEFQPGTWFWEFGDGETSGVRNPNHNYTAAGEYIVSLTINGADSTCIDTHTETIVVEDNSMNCQANFWWHHNCQSGNPLEIKFVNNSYTYGPITEFAWNFGDGTTSNEEDPIHVYTDYGLYDVNLAIVTESGCASERTLQVWVHDYTTNCMALFVPVIDSINPLQVYFEDYSLGQINSWYWEFGDSATSTEQNPTHIYAEAAVYTASLTIETFNCTSSFYYEINLISGQVMVSPGPTTGISDPRVSELSIYPNPVLDVLNIILNVNAPIEVKILNLTGQTLLTSTSTSIDVSALPKGIYFTSISVNGQNISRKFIK